MVCTGDQNAVRNVGRCFRQWKINKTKSERQWMKRNCDKFIRVHKNVNLTFSLHNLGLRIRYLILKLGVLDSLPSSKVGRFQMFISVRRAGARIERVRASYIYANGGNQIRLFSNLIYILKVTDRYTADNHLRDRQFWEQKNHYLVKIKTCWPSSKSVPSKWRYFEEALLETEPLQILLNLIIHDLPQRMCNDSELKTKLE
jgi:hypothetical protein